MQTRNSYFNSICINLCSACNLKCGWCYKQHDKEEFISYNDFVDFYDDIILQNINKIILIGGEPTIHPDFIPIMNMLSNKQIHLVTNGLMFSQQKFLNSCIDTYRNINKRPIGLQSISISLKGYDELSFLHTTKTNKFKALCHSIDNLRNCGISITYSYTISNDMVLDEIEKFLSFLIKYKIYSIVISDERPYINQNTITHPNMVKNLDKLIYILESNGIITYFRPNHPFCEYNSKLITFMINNKRLISNCTIKKNSGYIFTDSLELILCNELYTTTLGKYKLDFNNFDELNNLWNSQHIQNFYQRLSGCPQPKCIKCNMWSMCGGSCILHWIKG